MVDLRFCVYKQSITKSSSQKSFSCRYPIQKHNGIYVKCKYFKGDGKLRQD